MAKIALLNAEAAKNIKSLIAETTDNVTQGNLTMVNELAGSSDVLKPRVEELQKRTGKFRLIEGTPAARVAEEAALRPEKQRQRVKTSVLRDQENYWYSF
ncbi:MAG: chemoreceptor protein [Proteobacteria bacterium]|nr:chemoreceptor protein [Pseudomonadota bacterium]